MTTFTIAAMLNLAGHTTTNIAPDLTHPADIAFARQLDRLSNENLGLWMERITEQCQAHSEAWRKAANELVGDMDMNDYTPENWDAHYQPVVDKMGNYAGGMHKKAARTELLAAYRAHVEAATETATIKNSFAAIDLACVLQMFDEQPVPAKLVWMAIDWSKKQC